MALLRVSEQLAADVIELAVENSKLPEIAKVVKIVSLLKETYPDITTEKVKEILRSGGQ